MRRKPVLLRAAATGDVDAAFEHYFLEAGPEVAGSFMDALESAFAHIGLHAATGSPRYGHQLGVPGLRSWPMARFPYLVFYIEAPDAIDVVRVLHGAMDLPEWLLN